MVDCGCGFPEYKKKKKRKKERKKERERANKMDLTVKTTYEKELFIFFNIWKDKP